MRAALVVLALATAGCGTPSPLYTAEPATPQTAVDGRADEWPSALRPVPQEAGLSLGLRRDRDALVVVVVASDERQARRIALGGLRVWIDPEGGKGRVVGVRFPAPAPLTERMVRDRLRGTREATDALRRRFEESLTGVEITRGESAPVRVMPGTVGGLEAAASWDARRMVVELRLPLSATPGLLAATAGEAVGLGIELLDAQQRLPRPGRGGPADGPLPNPDRPQPETLYQVDTVTRWLRIESR